MCFRDIRNPIAVKFAQHLYSYFVIKLKENAKGRSYFPANLKQIVGCIKEKTGRILRTELVLESYLNQPERNGRLKKQEKYLKRGIESIMNPYKKKDDVADTFLQLQAFKIQVVTNERKV